jgi:DNA-binding HxlR family transcriptional regulator
VRNVPSRTYGQYCGLARALEVVGERWSMLIVRDLLVAPKRFTDLLRGLPGIPTNGLTARLKELEDDGIVRRRALSQPERAVVYELTEYGRELEEAVDALGRWGAKTLGDPRPGEIVTLDSMMSAMRSIFQPAAARGVSVTYELRFGEIVLHVRISGRKLTVGAGPSPEAAVLIESGPAIKRLFSGELSARDALAKRIVKMKGDPALLEQFARLFHIGDSVSAPPRSGI